MLHNPVARDLTYEGVCRAWIPGENHRACRSLHKGLHPRLHDRSMYWDHGRKGSRKIQAFGFCFNREDDSGAGKPPRIQVPRTSAIIAPQPVIPNVKRVVLPARLNPPASSWATQTTHPGWGVCHAGARLEAFGDLPERISRPANWAR